ncbi:MAG: Maf family nucleotide pyrophosphatase [Bacteroidota bacterium]
MAEARARDLVLASGSRSRRQMLEAAGASFAVEPAEVDENAIRETLQAGDNAIDPADVAEVLARAKAEAVSRKRPDALVIGADQVLALDDEIFEKPRGLDGARAHLRRLRGRAHQLHSAVVLAERGEVVWSYADTADLTMRTFSDQFLDDYLRRAGPIVCESVGAYQLEGLGIQLFQRIEGDYFTILGLPLLPLLAELRTRGALAA